MRRALAACLLLALAAGCQGETPRTQVMLAIDADPALREEIAFLHVHVFGGEAGRPVEMYASRRDIRYDELAWPWRVAMVPLDPDPPRAWLVDVTAERADGTPITASTVRGGYAPERTVRVELRLEETCAGVLCDRARCEDGRCVDPLVDVSTAPDLVVDGGP
ncbi:MAG TPA: hypothetical protein RMH99_17975 [Sandaracinaceae bacterium LLY-WYZ-13_1]|nr:hypothetical protein [Sandaracinaceae bacterium LLY-WYZ-13_1]